MQGRVRKKGPGGQRQECQVVSGIQPCLLAACRTAYLSLAGPPSLPGQSAGSRCSIGTHRSVVQSVQQATAIYAVGVPQLQVPNAVGVQSVLVLQGRHVSGCVVCLLLVLQVLLFICAPRHHPPRLAGSPAGVRSRSTSPPAAASASGSPTASRSRPGNRSARRRQTQRAPRKCHHHRWGPAKRSEGGEGWWEEGGWHHSRTCSRCIEQIIL